ncbi:molybdenum cofactor guanylyltransferase MobA [Ancylobacter sp. 6x-1]|uniref:Molybdenum cofactor guanylyltransferase n=1 Tax=Ancylobacter crimeensis TaxID=2579147 RepID=A0ABT0DCT8_9HYPH|nr:molybdenum cofactor guanylyltransferase MobA [Ancylobacter crimeensis]MCK0197781.1 molybdenum cofactor guanylyltransferase MobA [Ancylobacter crimeensis]
MPKIAGLILAGGLSRRMGGGDKGLLSLGGVTILERIQRRLAGQVETLLLNANGDAARFGAGMAVVVDTLPGHPGPLAGLLAGLDHLARYRPDIEWLLSVPCDAPFLPADLASRLEAALGEGQAACAMSGERFHPVIGLWNVSLSSMLRELLEENDERRAGRFAAEAGAERVAWAVQPYDPFLNVNTPDDIAAAEAILARYPSA